MPRKRNGVGDLGLHGGFNPGKLRFSLWVDLQQPGPEAWQRVFLQPFFQFTGRAVAPRFKTRVPLLAVGHALQQGWPAALARLLDGVLGRLIYGQHIIAVQPERLHVVGRCPFRHRADRHRPADRG